MDDSNETPSGSFPAPSPGRCIYGFVLFLVSLVGLILYNMWAFIPTSAIHATGITYIPSKYWAISLPVFLVMLITLFAIFLYPAINLLLTPPLHHYSTVYDAHSNRWTRNGNLNSNNNNQNNSSKPMGIPAISDLPLDFVSQQLYLSESCF